MGLGAFLAMSSGFKDQIPSRVSVGRVMAWESRDLEYGHFLPLTFVKSLQALVFLSVK